MDPGMDLPCPFPSEVSPFSAAVDEASLAWLHRFGLVREDVSLDRLDRQRSGNLAARTNPGADRERLQILSDWYTWLFAFDDCHSESGPESSQAATMSITVGRLSRSLDCDFAVVGPMSVYADALRDIRDRISAHCSPAQLDRWIHAVQNYFQAQVWEAANRELDLAIDLDEYIAMRRHTGATYTCLALIEMACGIEIAPHVALAPPLARLNDMVANLVSWDNDLFSYAKEKNSDGGRHNLLAVLARTRGRPVAQIKADYLALRNAEMRKFLDSSAATAAGAPHEVLEYLEKLGLWLRGHIEWSKTTSRFTPQAN